MIIIGNTDNTNWKLLLETYEIGSYDITNNTSTVRVDMYLRRINSQGYLGGNWSGSITVDGQIKNLSGNIAYPTYVNKDTNLYLGTKDYTVGHNADGSKVANVSALFSSSEFSPSSGSASGNLTLTTIPRASSVTATNADIESATSININRASSSFTHTLKYSFGSLSGTIVSKTNQTSYGWTLPDTFYAQIPNNAYGTCTITCETYNGNTLIGTKTTTFIATANQNICKPAITGSVVDTNSDTIALTGDNTKLVKYHSNASITWGATAKNSASIIRTYINSEITTTSPKVINNIGVSSIPMSTLDSRGYRDELLLEPTVVNYIPLSASVSFYRTAPTTGEVSLEFSGNYFNGSFGNENNTLTIKWYYKEKDAQSYTLGGTLVENTDYIISDNTFHSGTSSYTDDISLGNIFDYQKAYDFKIEIYDKLETRNPVQTVTKGEPTYWWNNDKFEAIGDLVAKNVLNVKGYVKDTLSVDNLESSNKFNINDIVSDYATATIGKNKITVSSSIAFASCHIDIKNLEPNTEYTISADYIQQGTLTTIRLSPRYLEDINTEINAVSKTTETGTINTTLTTSYSGELRIYFYPNFTSSSISAKVKFTNLQIKKGSEILDYTEYVNYSDKKVYSTKERIIGTWTDGKPIYERVFTGTNSSSKLNIATITDMDLLIDLKGSANLGTGNQFPINYYYSSSYFLRTWINTKRLLHEAQGYTGYNLKIIVQYTKTTD